MQMTLSIRALYNYDNSIFDDIVFPTDFNKQNFIDYILLNFAELECLYPNPEYLKKAVKAWSIARQKAWVRIWTALSAEYSPIENYDRQEEWVDHTQGENNNSVTEDKTDDGTTNGTNDATITNYATSFNSDTPKETDHSVAHSEAAGTSHNQDHGTTNGKETKNEENTRTGRAHGNIGVTTNQRMITEELELRKNDFCHIVADEFKLEFLLQIY